MNKQNKLLDTERVLMVAKRRVEWIGEVGEGIKRYKLVVTK